MHDLPSLARRGLATALLSAVMSLPVEATTTQTATTTQDDRNTQDNAVNTMGPPDGSPVQVDPRPEAVRGSMLTVPAFAPLFATPEDAQAYWDMLHRSYGWSAFDPRSVAKSFIKERMGIDGDKYVVAHFATTQNRMEGSADNVMVLTDAVMNAFPEHSRHTFFAMFADAVGGLTSGGRQTPSAVGFADGIVTCGNAGECFRRTGRFIWSRTGPGYVYNTFIGEGNVLETVHEDARPLDLAFGIYPKSSSFLPEHVSPFLLSQVVDKFKEEGLFSELPYIKRLKAEFDAYWETGRTEWPVLARYQFVHEARRALARRVLTQQQYALVMKGGAPQVPLQGPMTLNQLRNTPADASVRVRRFDINGYPATDMLRFVASDGSEVMYIPGARSPFVTFHSEAELRDWVVHQARTRETLDDLLSHFSIYNTQDGTFWTGVTQGLARLADGRWTVDNQAIDAANEGILGDVFEDMGVQVEARLRDDARMRTSTAWDAWRTTLNRSIAVLGPVGYVPPLAIPVQTGIALVGLGTELDEGINGRTTAERKRAMENAVMTVVTSASVGAVMSRQGTGPWVAQPPPWLRPPEIRVMSPSPSVSSVASVSEVATEVTTVPVPSTSSQTGSGARPLLMQGGEARIAYSMGPLVPRREQAELQQRTHPQASGSSNALPPAAVDGSQPRREFDPQGTDARTPFNLLAIERELERRGFLVQGVSSSAYEQMRRVIDLKKTEIDEARHRLDDFRTESLRTNLAGYQLSFDHSLVFRVDSRRPRDLLRGEGFGPSSEFNDLTPMLRQPSTIGSGSIRGSNIVFVTWQRGYASLTPRPTFHQYAIWTERRPVATASDNHEQQQYDYILDEVHFPADVPAQNIYIIDSFDQGYAQALANIYQSPHVSTPYGVPLDAFEEYLAGRLDIGAPNRFSEPRPPGSQTSSPVTTSESPPAPAPVPATQPPASVN